MGKHIGQGKRPLRKTYFREWREYRGLTQDQLAERMETNKGAISKIENGHSTYNQSSLEAWALALQCEPADLITRDPNSDDPQSLLATAAPAMQIAVTEILKANRSR